MQGFGAYAHSSTEAISSLVHRKTAARVNLLVAEIFVCWLRSSSTTTTSSSSSSRNMSFRSSCLYVDYCCGRVHQYLAFRHRSVCWRCRFVFLLCFILFLLRTILV